MRTRRIVIGLTLTGLALAVGCGSSGSNNGGSKTDASAGSGAEAGATGGNNSGGSSAAGGGIGTGGANAGGTGGGAGTAPDAGGGTTGSGGVANGGTGNGGTGNGGTGNGGATGSAGSGGATCHIATCQGHVYQCGDCKDNDGDGLVDMADPDCLGPCDNNEAGFDGCVSGQNNAPCKADCYFDQDTGSGNDDCYWNRHCDPLEVAPNYPPQGSQCAYNPNFSITGTSSGTQTCTQAYNTQSAQCNNYCGPLTPNGCDCFGCCAIPDKQGVIHTVYLGSTSDNSGKCSMATCDLAHVDDPTKCKPCTQVKGCLNTCLHCELCLGKTTLPPDCLPPKPDAGTGGSGGAGGTSTGGAGGTSSGGTGGTSSGGTGGTSTGGTGGGCGGQICPTGETPCGLSCQPPCPSGQFCNTGCCVAVPG